MTTDQELTEEEIMLNDEDPMDAIRAIRREEGVSEDDLPQRVSDVSNTDVLDQKQPDTKAGDDAAELAALESGKADDKAEEEATAAKIAEEEKAAAALEAGDDEAAKAAAAADAAIEAANKAADEATEKKAAEDKAAADYDALSDEEKVVKDAADKAAAETAEKAEKEKKKAPVVTTRKFRANGQEFEFTEQEILDQFEVVFGQSMNYTKKMQKIAPYRKMISALEQEGVTQEALNLAIDALKGDKGALKKLMDDNKIDAYDLTSDGDEPPVYNPKTYGKDETSLDIEEITRTIQGDEEFAITTNVIDEQWDDRSRQMIKQNPGIITGLHNDIKTGLYDKVAPIAMKMQVLDGNTKSSIEYYMIAGEQVRVKTEAEFKQKNSQSEVDKRNADTQNASDEFDKASSEANRKRSAKSTGSSAEREKGVTDYLDDDDEAFDAWYKKTMAT